MAMDLSLLGGNHPGNKQWLIKVKNKLASLFGHTHPLIYNHWQTKQGNIDLNKEVSKLANLSQTLTNYAIFAKSAGIAVVLLAYHQGVIHPKVSFFVGLPISWFKSNKLNITYLLQNYPIPTLILQNQQDPLGPASLVADILNRLNLDNYQLSKLKGDDHIYTDLTTIRSRIYDFISQT